MRRNVIEAAVAIVLLTCAGCATSTPAVDESLQSQVNAIEAAVGQLRAEVDILVAIAESQADTNRSANTIHKSHQTQIDTIGRKVYPEAYSDGNETMDR